MKENTKRYPLYQRLLSIAMAALMVFGIIPLDTRAATTAEEYTVDHTTTVADPDTVSRPVDVYGDDTANAGKVTVGKSVSDGPVTLHYGNTNHTFTPGTDNFVVTVSQTAQILGLASESSAPVDVVFVLDTSNSMNGGRSTSMVSAANKAIASLLTANEYNRVGVVAFSSYGSSTSDYAANQLSALAHYDDVDANNDGDLDDRNDVDAASNHLRWANRWGQVTSGGSYILGRGTNAGSRDAIDGGTNIHAGVALGAQMLTSASTTALIDGKEVTRMPFLVILSDGAPTFSASGGFSDSSKWYEPNMQAEQGPGGSYYAGNGFLAALTAAYYKGSITEHYYGAAASEDKRCYIYTIGVGLENETGNARALARITMDPDTYFAPNSTNTFYNSNGANDFYSYWENYVEAPQNGFTVQVNSSATYRITRASINATKNYVNGLNASGKKMYDGGLAYNDDHFSANQTSEIEAAFNKALQEIQLKAMSSPTKVDSAFGEDFSGYVTFTDPIGEYMEVKDMYGVLANGNWYRGKTFAQYLDNWNSAPQAFKDLFIKVLQERCRLSGATVDVNDFISKASASANQAYYNSDTDFDNSIVWWGNAFTAPNEEDEQVQYLGFADDDSIEYIEQQKAAGNIPAGADYVCRSYFFYGTAGNTVVNPNHEYLYFVVRVQRSLTAPYQQTVVISAPASLLSVEKVMITETKDASGRATYSAVVTEAEPARVVYEVGLRSDINAFNVDQILAEDAAVYDYTGETAVFGGNTVNTNYDTATGTYTFYTNDWDRTQPENDHERAMTKATFDAAADNGFYTYTEDTPIYVRSSNGYTLYTGATKPTGTGYYYAKEVYDWSDSSLVDGAYTATKRTEYVEVNLPNTDAVKSSGDNWYISAGVYKASALTGGEDVYKASNDTNTSVVVAHPHRTASETNSHYTVYLGNNGKLTLKAADTKSVDITKPDNTVITDANGKVVMVGDVLTYTVKIINGGDGEASAVATDVIPTGTEYVEGSATEGGVYDSTNKTITWTVDQIPAGHFVEVSFQVKVTEAALTGEFGVVTIDNRAHVKLDNGFAYETNITRNPPEGKKVVNTDGTPITGAVDIPDVLVYRIRWHNDSGSTADVTVTDIIPMGTSYVADSASHNGVYDANAKTITWTMRNVAAGASGVVSFRVNVNAAAGETIENGAEIRIGENDPRVTNKTSVTVDKGDLVLSKDVITNGFAAADDQEFVLRITEAGLGMTGTFTMLKNGETVEGGITFNKGVATVTIKDDDVIEIRGITAGAIISVTEDAKNGFTPAYAPATGTVTVVKNSDTEVAVTNTYKPNAVQIQLQANKVLNTSFEVDATTFGFTAQPCDANGVANTAKQPLTGEVTVSSQNKNALITFSAETFSTEGTYYYLISEINGGVAGVDYAEDRYIVQVDVTDDGTGQLKAATKLVKKHDGTAFVAVGNDDTLTFTNTYAPKETELVLTGDKVLFGRDLRDGEFSFVVKDSSGNDVTYGINDEEGNIVFQPIRYTTVGDHTYTVTEVNSGEKGISYSTQSFTVTVKVEDVDGQLVATPTYPAGGVVFENTYTPEGIEVVLAANKVIDNKSGTDRVLAAGEFSFVVKDAQGNEIAAGKNDANGNVAFSPIGYTRADAGKTYTYYISEIIPDVSADPYMHYDANEYTVTVTVSYDSETGELSAQVAYENDAAPVFTNVQYPSSVSVTPGGHKTTTALGSTANVPDTTFAFTIVDMDGEEVGAGIGNANGDFLFSKLTYTEAGTYKYWIKETHAGQTVHGIEYDDAVYLMVVEVTKTSGKLEPTVAYYSLKEGGEAADPADYTVAVANKPTFENTYDAKGQITLTAKKVLTNRALDDGDFAFRLIRQDNGHEITGVVAANGTITFATLHFDLSEFEENQTTKTIYYKMSEIIPVSGKLPGVKYDESIHDVYVTITHNNDGTISAAVTDQNGEVLTGEDDAPLDPKDTNVTFTNTYTPTEGTSATIHAKKVLNGRTLRSGEFGFNLYHVGETTKQLVDTAANDANGLISFTRTYLPTVLTGGADSREIKYEIREVNNHLGGVDYSKAATYWVLVTVADNKEEGKLESTVKYYSDEACTQEITDLSTVQFVNEYEAESTTFKPEATKDLNNRALRDNEFLFVVKDETGKTVSTGYNEADGTVVFTEIGYDTAGEYIYTISETNGGRGDMGYSDAVYYLKVTVTDNLDGTMTASGEYFSDAACDNKIDVSEVIFVNTYKPTSITVKLEATKVLRGHAMQDGSFSFLVYDVTDPAKPVASGSNVAADAGETVPIIFSNIGYTFDMLSGEGTSRTFIYAISEQVTTHGGVETDDAVYYAKVVLSHNAQNGQLTTAVTYHTDESCTDENKITGVPGFVNTYDPADAEVILQAEKTLINKKLEAGEFTFTLQGEGVAQSKTNDASGIAVFDKLTFDAPGVYSYTIAEAVSTGWNAERYTLDHAFKVIVTVEDDLRGKLVATVTYHEILDDGSYDQNNVGAAEFINRYTAPPVTVDLTESIDADKTVKTPDGVTYSPEDFTFQVTDTTGRVIKGWKDGQEVDMIGISDAAGKITFPSFRFATAGEYHYWIAEQPSNVEGMTDDLRVWEVHILVRYNRETGLLYINRADVKTYPVGSGVSDPIAPEFINVFEPVPITLTLEATKLLEGRTLKDREFQFYLMEGSTIVAEGYNDVGGKVRFELAYTAEDIGTHTYTVKEVVPENANNGVTYDGKTYTAATVKVSYDTVNHKLAASVNDTPVSNGAVISTGVKVTNLYTAAGTSVQIQANKIVTADRVLKDKEFTFGLMDSEEQVVATAKNDAAGWITFQLSYDKAGTYTYEIFEQPGEDESLTYDENRYTVTVTVTDDLHGQLHAVVEYEDNNVPTFVNEYRPLATTATVQAKKVLEGNKTLSAGDFTFELEREDGVKVTAENLADGLIKFGMRYDEAGVYTYTLREVAGEAAGVTYDDAEYTVTVTVTDNLEGSLEATVAYEGLAEGETVPTFLNTYQGKAAAVQITATKKLTGKTLTADAYSFTLTNKDNTKDVHTVKNDANGNVVFDLKLTEVGTYTYILAETAGNDTNVTYDKNTYTVTVKVTDDLQGNLKAEVSYGTTDGKAPTFENIYTPSAITVKLTGEKTLKGRDMKADEFAFEVRDAAGTVVATAKNTAKGELVFTDIALNAAGKYTFSVTEVKGSVKGMIYDDTKYTVTVEVVNENGVLKATVTEPKGGLVFRNTYKKPDPTNPNTGDDTPLLLLVGMMVVSGSAVAALLVDRKKRYAGR